MDSYRIIKNCYRMFGLCVIVGALTGCSSVPDYLGQKMLEKSGIESTDTYMDYTLNYQGNVDSDGFYIENVEASEEIGTKITFSSNSNLRISYYWDIDFQNVVDIDSCYVEKGDTIYARVEISRNVYSSTYEFTEFRFYEFDDEGAYESDAVKAELTGEVYLISFSNIDDIGEIRVEPVGDYQNRYITLNEYCKCADGNIVTNGVWKVNSDVYTAGEIEINPYTSYIISYEYNNEEYFFSGSTPECYYSDYADGVVIFNQRDADDATINYTVELRKYISVKLVTDINRNICVGNGENQYVAANNTIDIDKLRFGQTVVIYADKKWNNLKSIEELVWLTEETLTNDDPLSNNGLYKYKYVLKVPEEDGQFRFNPSEYSYEHGKISFFYHGEIVTDELVLAQGRRIEYAESTADDGYWLAGRESDHYIIIGNEEETRKQFESIQFTLKSPVKVNLKQPQYGGRIIYSIEGKEISGSSIDTYSGAKISMAFKPWEGWVCEVQDGMEYVVNGNSSAQSVKVDNYSVDEIFSEDDNHKPKLSISLNKSVGTSMSFNVKASGIDLQDAKYSGSNPFVNEKVIIDKEKIGTGAPIKIEMSNRAIQTGTAIKIVIQKIDSNKKEKSITRYYTDIRDASEHIYIYEPGYEEYDTTWYNFIDITVSVVDIEVHSKPKESTNTSINIQNATTKEYLLEGDYIEPSQKVIVTIRANTGYYLTGSKLTNDSYIQEMKYSDYLKNIDSLISEHPAEKYITITLDASDSFAIYVYKRDGAIVSGTVNVKKDAEIELTYEITDSSHKLNKSYGGFIGIGASNKKATVSLKIASQYDGKTIKKEDFGLELE